MQNYSNIQKYLFGAIVAFSLICFGKGIISEDIIYICVGSVAAPFALIGLYEFIIDDVVLGLVKNLDARLLSILHIVGNDKHKNISVHRSKDLMDETILEVGAAFNNVNEDEESEEND